MNAWLGLVVGIGLLHSVCAQTQFSSTPRLHLPASVGTMPLQHADLDGNGDVDFVTGHHSLIPNQGGVFLNDGHGIYQRTDTFGLHPNALFSVALADFDGDGDSDVVVASTVTRLHLNDGARR